MAQLAPNSAMLTLEEYEGLPADDLYRDELSHGFLVREPTPGAEHSRMMVTISYLLMRYVDAHPGCGAVYAEGGFLLSERPPTVRAPDVAYVRAERVPNHYFRGYFKGAPDLAIEILSPSNRPGAMLHKVAQFLEAGAIAVWVVDPETRTVVIHEQTALPCIMHEDDVLDGGELLPGLRLQVKSLFPSYK